ncbi:MAG: hypothetical protein M0P47_09130 [Bacteroidales bacterium]|nr:hypothetical protein [Bacteroidales bacterium]
MKKLKLIFLFLLVSIGAQAQFAKHIDTLKFIGQTGETRGKIYECVTYGNADSITINGIKFYTTQSGIETDPIWLSDSSQYPKKTYADNRYEYKIAAETFMSKIADDTISGVKIFNDETLGIFNSTGDGYAVIRARVSSGIGNNITFPDSSGTVALTSNLYKMTRYVAYSSGNNNVEVLADSAGIVVTVANTNEFTFAIPPGVRLISSKIRLGTGFTTIKLFMDTDDMGNTSATNRWMAICQGWREDSGQQLTGLTTTMDNSGSPNYQKITINGLITGANNQIRISF